MITDTMGSVSHDASIIIIGAGCFGSSTAYHLAKRRPSAKITLIDCAAYPNPRAAAHDINKIVRADYPDLLYMKLALEAQTQWRTDPIFAPYYHESGMLFAEDFGMGRDALENYKSIFGEKSCPATMLKPEHAMAKFPMYRDANWKGLKMNFYNPNSGWAEADKALESLIRATVDLGVEYRIANVSKLMVESLSGAATGVLLSDGEMLAADKLVVCAGAHTETLLADSVPEDKLFRADGRLVAAAAVSCFVRVPEHRRHDFVGAPVMFNGLDHTHGEAIPMTADGIIKFNFELSFTNLQPHEASGRTISIPPNSSGGSVWSHDAPETFKAEIKTVMKHIYGRLVEGLEPESYRMCWDSVTPNQDWIISPHPHSIGLYVASGGSFHAWKFLPNIGKYVADMLDNELPEDMSRKWSWDREDVGAACEMYIPTRDLKSFQ